MTKFDHIFIAPKNFDLTLAFYNSTLGFKVVANWGEKGVEGRGAIMVSDGGMKVVIAENHETDDHAKTHGHNGVRPSIHLNVPDISAVFKNLPKGAHVLVEPEDTHWGTRWFVLQDPDENIIAFEQNL